MRTFRCRCGARVFFENTKCLSCGTGLGFLPDVLAMASFPEDGSHEVATPYGAYRKCGNYLYEGVCNWMVTVTEDNPLCQACRLNNVIPDLSISENRALWMEVEQAKRRLVFSLNRLGLRVVPKTEDPRGGVCFDIKAEDGTERVLTGHRDGLITMNLGEADAAQREAMRLSMKERYRTLLGHFRHEIGHYYWDRLVSGSPSLAAFRELFGDERASYADALRRHYGGGAQQGDADTFISQYAAVHPWEDFAETFAHYLHLVDTLETAEQYGFARERTASALPSASSEFEALIAEWLRLTVALNALNRSMGLPDAYPFAISPGVKRKLAFVDEMIRGAARGTPKR